MSDPLAARPSGELRARTIRGSVLELGGFGAGQFLRFAANLVMTRLLFPEAFGLMALVFVLIQGLEMLSDVGLQASVMQNRRGDEPRFLNTAWTIQIVRGAVLAACAAALAWPGAWLYDEPQLRALLPVAALNLLIAGFNSTSLLTLRRRISIGRIMAIELSAQVVSTTTMIVWAWLHPTVWALVGATLVRSALVLIASHGIRVAPRNRIAWDAGAAVSLFHFGKWIFGSSALHFVSRQADRLLLGRFIGMTGLGVYSIAVFLSEALADVVTRVTHGVLFAALSEVHRQDRARIPDVFYRARLPLDAGIQTALGGLAAAGSLLVSVLYDTRYADAGWILQALAFRVSLFSVLTPAETCLFAMGHTRYGFYRSVARALWIVVALPVGWSLGGLPGVVTAVALSELPVLLVIWPAIHRYGVLRLRREALAFGFFAVGMAGGEAIVWLVGRYGPT